MDREEILRISAKIHEELPETASDSDYEEAMRKAAPHLYAFADEFEKMSPEEQAAIRSLRIYGGDGP